MWCGVVWCVRVVWSVGVVCACVHVCMCACVHVCLCGVHVCVHVITLILIYEQCYNFFNKQGLSNEISFF